MKHTHIKPTPFKNYYGALLYDTILVIAILFLASIVYMIPFMFNAPIDSSEAKNLSNTSFQTPTYKTWIFFIWFGFFAWFWTKSGQTLGLRVWKLRLVANNGAMISIWQALLRFFASLLPWVLALFLYDVLDKNEVITSSYKYLILLLGFSNIVSSFFDKDRLSFHDKFSETKIIYEPD